MKVVVTGASGNVGTAVLRALAAADDVTEVVGIARRVPRRTPPAPYSVASWVSIDVGARNGRSVVGKLAAAMAGADAVIHLAWAIQPTHNRDRLRRTNVLGTSRVLAAVRVAGVTNVVVASSSGTYSPCHDDVPHGETWPTDGVPTCEYSVYKAEVEQLYDEHESAHPEVTITRLRPALIFQRDAGSEILRYFVGPLIPPALLNGKLPMLPWPRGMRLQAVHATDVAQAYLAAVRLKPGGAFNIAADDVLGGAEIASLMAGGRTAEVPTGAVRSAVSAGWNTRGVPISPGWIDMAANVPVMSTAKAKAELGWSPQHSAYDTIAEVLQGMADGAGTASPPLRPRGIKYRH
jgi:nucleoside-diphosphate-sugar epimerase